MAKRKKERLRIIPNHKVNFEDTKKLIKYYKLGYSLIELSRGFHIDFSFIIYTIKKAKIKRAQLHKIYKAQAERKEHISVVCVPEKERIHVEKLFPQIDDSFTNSYYVYWKEKYTKAEEKKKKCKHHIKHVQCSLCGKILADSPVDDL